MEQHKPLPVKGYVSQSSENVDYVNRNKLVEELILKILDELNSNAFTDKRWLAIGRTHIEQGFMAINRAVFQPKRVVLNNSIVRVDSLQGIFTTQGDENEKKD